MANTATTEVSKLVEGRQKYGLTRYLTRQAKKQFNKLLFRSNRRALVRAFESIGAHGERTVCVHASLSRLGYIEGGPGTVVDALFDVLGEAGCIMMPSFSMDGTMLSYLESGATFDVRATPARVGAIAEVFRRRDGVVRSLHPTNSVAAFGGGAVPLLQDHEKSLTPYGYATPYGRLAEDENSYVLMLDTHIHSLLHHIQERVDFPNLFLEQEREVPFIDHDGSRRSMRTKVMRPRIPYFVALRPVAGREPDWAILHDFALMFPGRRDKEAARLGYRSSPFKLLERRRKDLAAKGILRARRFGRGEIGLLHVASFVRAIQPEFEESIREFRSYYDVAYLEAKNLRLG